MSEAPTNDKPATDSPADQPKGAAAPAAPATSEGAEPVIGSKGLWIASAVVLVVFASVWGTIFLSVVNPARSKYQGDAENRSNTSGPTTPGPATPANAPPQTRPQTRPAGNNK